MTRLLVCCYWSAVLYLIAVACVCDWSWGLIWERMGRRDYR